MKVRFWGVRGSIAVSGPKHARYGGNTSCVEITAGSGRVILDAGTGLRPLGLSLSGREALSAFCFLSHYHLDHVFGLPFFAPLYDGKAHVRIYGPGDSPRELRRVLQTVFSPKLFPVTWRDLPARVSLGVMSAGKAVSVPPLKVRAFPLNHPGRTQAYMIEHDRRRVAYVTDHEPVEGHCHGSKTFGRRVNAALREHLQGVDLLIHDAHFFDDEYASYRGWGHSPAGYALALARACGVNRLILTHHAPEHDDRSLERLRKKIARQRGLNVIVAYDGLEVKV